MPSSICPTRRSPWRSPTSAGSYWNQNEATRPFAERFRAQVGRPPSKAQAAVYAATRHWLSAVAATGSISGAVTTKAMTSKTADYFGQQATIQPNGRVIYDLCLFQVKTPAESRGPWDYYKEVAKLRGDEAFRPLSESECPLARP